MATPSTIPRSRKPRGLVRVNFGHPLAKDIAFFYYYVAGGTAGVFYDAVTGLMCGTASGQTTSDGDMAYNGSARSTTTTAFQNPNAVTTVSLTVIAGCKLTAKPANRCAVITYGASGGGRASACGFNSSGNAGGMTLTTGGIIPAVDAVDHINEYVVIAGSSDGGSGGSGTSWGWVNGVKYINGGGSNAGVTTTTVSLGRDTSGYFNNFTGTITFAMGFNRVVRDDEHRELALNPWQILERQQQYAGLSQTVGGATKIMRLPALGVG